MSPYLFPCITIGINVGSCLTNLWKGDASRAVYWLAAAVLNVAITFPFPRLPWSH